MSYQYFIYIFLFTFAFYVTNKLVPKVINFCSKYNLKEVPEERKEHLFPMPRLGGFSLFTGYLVTIICFLIINLVLQLVKVDINQILSLSLCSLLIYILGSADDLYNLRAYPRLVGQFIVAFLAYFLGFRIECIDLSFFSDSSFTFCLTKALSLFVTSFWIVGIINAINWIDGIDGLAGLLISISALAYGFISLNSNQYLASIFVFITLGSTLAFLKHNYYPAKIFMGDGGSYFLGFNIAIISIISGSSQPIIFNPLQSIFLIGIPIFDMVYVIFGRIFKGKTPFLPDRSHYHHRFLKLGFGHRKIFLSSFLISLFFVFIGMKIAY